MDKERMRLLEMRQKYSLLTNATRKLLAEVKNDVSTEDMAEVFTFKESVMLVYIPIILTKAAYTYAIRACDMSATMKLPYKKNTRAIREAVMEFNLRAIPDIDREIVNMLQAQVDSFFVEVRSQMNTLWFTVQGEILKQYPNITDNAKQLLGDIYVCKSLLRFVHELDMKHNDIIAKRIHRGYWAGEFVQTAQILKNIEPIISGYNIEETLMIKQALKVIGNRVNSIIEVEFD